ncbi:MAG: lipocalin family protein [Paracoccaceae bacterium]
MKTLSSALIALGLVLPSAAVAGGRYGDDAAPIATVERLDINRYAGLWYEIARFPNRFERNCFAVTAEYTLRDDGTVGVTNTCRKGSVDGRVDVANGSARVEGVGRLSVNFVSFLPFIRGDYFVLDVTPDYSMAVVGEPGRDYGWILARSPALSEGDYNRALSVLERNGYRTEGLERVVHP